MSREIKKEFSVRLRYAREELRKISQGRLAELTGFKPAAISHFETGARKPSFDNLKRLADSLEVTTDFLLGRVDNPEEIKEADQLYRDIKNLSSGDKEFAEKMIAEIIKRGK
ncbi:MAG: helix-turn-helix transcriptional regulator [Burkholderiales bacterium]|nr:helix-turn-helix transcriptional regulator [Nitrosomonas sp.]MCP5275527.1 helix-turn-helix transcriptional regulator [Burkholderiales bacterium]